jgi:hypothetical protein
LPDQVEIGSSLFGFLKLPHALGIKRSAVGSVFFSANGWYRVWGGGIVLTALSVDRVALPDWKAGANRGRNEVPTHGGVVSGRFSIVLDRNYDAVGESGYRGALPKGRRTLATQYSEIAGGDAQISPQLAMLVIFGDGGLPPSLIGGFDSRLESLVRNIGADDGADKGRRRYRKSDARYGLFPPPARPIPSSRRSRHTRRPIAPIATRSP